MNTYQILCLVGIPSIVSLIIGYLVSNLKNTGVQVVALKLGMQALLRDRLHQAHKKFMEQGYCAVPDKENFDNMYKQYHSLGQNGVMDGLYQEVMALPTVPPKVTTKTKA